MLLQKMKDPFDFGPSEVRFYHDLSRDIDEISALSSSLKSSSDSSLLTDQKQDAWFQIPHPEILGSSLVGTLGRLSTLGRGEQGESAPSEASLQHKSVGKRLTSSARPRQRGDAGDKIAPPEGNARRESVTTKLTSSARQRQQRRPEPTKATAAPAPIRARRSAARVEPPPPAARSPPPAPEGTATRARVRGVAAAQMRRTSKRQQERSLNDSKDDFSDLQALLDKHNKKFKSNHTYEPRNHSLRDVKAWEKKFGKTYSSLSVSERRKANEQISAMLQSS